MSLHDPLPECAGWFGKIPSLGDFVRRNLPESFVDRWDEWLSEELSEAQTVLTDDWSQLWRHAPIWCFALGAGVLDARSWLGVLVPSVDRVGREFPLTIALSPGRLAVARGAAWWAALEALGRSAVGADGGADRLDEDLAAFVSAHSELAHDLEAAASGAERALAVPGEGTSVWWCMPAGEGREAAPLVLAGLPRGDAFRLLLQRSSSG